MKFIPLEKILPGGGSKELSVEEYRRGGTTRLRSGIQGESRINKES